jgi:transposase-like protein
VAGNWTYLYRAVDSAGDTIDFMLSPKRDLRAAKLSSAWHCPALAESGHG